MRPPPRPRGAACWWLVGRDSTAAVQSSTKRNRIHSVHRKREPASLPGRDHPTGQPELCPAPPGLDEQCWAPARPSSPPRHEPTVKFFILQQRDKKNQRWHQLLSIKLQPVNLEVTQSIALPGAAPQPRGRGREAPRKRTPKGDVHRKAPVRLCVVILWRGLSLPPAPGQPQTRFSPVRGREGLPFRK
ncbi:TIR domain-containing adapter molecule 1 [Platysternon megacephalum]|uniref:TIR domain-containing adapter molecule 1 n=1 Tax=Platysternon megacephalum TaxID=55544 RepID=A0A4D9DUR2_9SAUR|nr:TIR domain-containing adapter molecule 1 [Platysternon megacephalum]